MWPLVHDMLSAILAPEHARAANPLVRRAALGLLRICRRLLPYQTDSAHTLLKSMQMILRLDPAVAWDLAAAIAREVPSYPLQSVFVKSAMQGTYSQGVDRCNCRLLGQEMSISGK